MSAERIYAVEDGQATRLIRASSQAQALRHVARDTFVVTTVSALETAELMGKGIKLEVAGAETEGAAP